MRRPLASLLMPGVQTLHWPILGDFPTEFINYFRPGRYQYHRSWSLLHRFDAASQESREMHIVVSGPREQFTPGQLKYAPAVRPSTDVGRVSVVPHAAVNRGVLLADRTGLVRRCIVRDDKLEVFVILRQDGINGG